MTMTALVSGISAHNDGNSPQGHNLNIVLSSFLQNSEVDVQHEDCQQVHHPHGEHGQGAGQGLQAGGEVWHGWKEMILER